MITTADDTAPVEAVHTVESVELNEPAQPGGERSSRLHTARLVFRNWRRSRPFWAGLWAVIGGAIIAYVPATAVKLVLVANASLTIGIGVGVLVGLFGLMLWFVRPLRVLLGVLIMLLSFVSFFTSDFGGLMLGMLMGLVGGSLSLAWVPTKVTARQRRRARKLAANAEPAVDDSADEAPDSDSVEQPSELAVLLAPHAEVPVVARPRPMPSV